MTYITCIQECMYNVHYTILNMYIECTIAHSCNKYSMDTVPLKLKGVADVPTPSTFTSCTVKVLQFLYVLHSSTVHVDEPVRIAVTFKF